MITLYLIQGSPYLPSTAGLVGRYPAVQAETCTCEFQTCCFCLLLGTCREFLLAATRSVKQELRKTELRLSKTAGCFFLKKSIEFIHFRK